MVPAAAGQTPGGETDWAALYEELEARVLPYVDEPTGYPADLEPYLQWMERKAVDRDAVKQARDDAFDAAHGNPEWAAEFDALLQTAQRSGEGTAWDACWKFLRIKNDDDWQTTLFKARTFGRKIYQKAAETGFDPEFVRDEWARCLLRYSINVVEGGEKQGLSLYSGRVKVLAEWGEDGLLRIPRRDFDVTCERSTEFVMQEKGEPLAPADMGLEWVEGIRKECDWWRLGRERADATELMNQFLKDDLCLRPQERSHKWYIELAGKYDGLEEAAEYARGFYATLKGTVWIEEDGERRPANGARVTVTDPKDGTQWHATTDSEGEYRIEDALLHTHEGGDGWPRCPTFKISAEHEGDRVDDTYEGDLSEPNTSAEHTKDLVIQGGDQWDVTITYTEDVDGEEREGDKKRTVGRHYAATFKARVRLAEADSQRSLYRSEDSSIELHDNYTWHYVDNECNHRGGFTGEKKSRGLLPIEVQFNPGSQRFYFRFARGVEKEVISYRFAGQLLGPDQHCTGAWEYEAPSSRSVLPADWEESVGQRQYTPGQTRITGDAILDSGMAFVWPDNPQMFEPQMRGDMFQAIFMMNAQIGGYSPLILTSLPIKQTLTWEIKRPE